MEVTILGTGAAIPVAGRHQTGLLLEDDEQTLLVDAGNGVLHRLAETDTELESLDTVLLTHLHLDHVADLPSILKARVLSGENDFTVIGPPETTEVLDNLLAIDDLHERADLTVEEIGPGEHVVNGFTLTARETVHSAYCLAYRFGDQFTFSGDSEATPAVARLADGCQALLHDCAYPDDHDDPSNHATPTSLGQTLRDADTTIDDIYLTHLYPDAAEQAEEMRQTVESFVDATVHVAADGDIITTA